MKLAKQLFVLTTCFVAAGGAHAGSTLASTLDVYVLPKDGQTAEEQSKAESECYSWAVENSGVDPFDAQKKEAQAAEQAEAQKEAATEAGKGAGAKGALRGAAAGAVVGEIADDDASEGAAWGAAAGAVASRRRTRAAKQSAAQQAEASEEQAKKASAEDVGKFKKAFSVCLEAKDYMVKY